MNSEHFSNGKINHLRAGVVPTGELRGLHDALSNPAGDSETSTHIPMLLEYSDSEDWYWLYGHDRLYQRLQIRRDPSWPTLHRFVTDYAWLEGRFRFILDKPCWPLHIDVVDRVLMLYYGRKNYEEHRAEGDAKDHLDFLNLLERVAAEVRELLGNCDLKTGIPDGGGESYLYARHIPDDRVRNWIPLLLHRVLRWDGIPLPDGPVLDAAGNLGGEEPDTDGPGGTSSGETA